MRISCKKHINSFRCTILWISFLRKATYLPTRVGTSEESMDILFVGAGPNEDDMANQVHDLIIGASSSLVSHKVLHSIKESMDAFSNRPCVVSNTLINSNHMVADLLVVDKARLVKWKEIVVES